MKKTKRLLACLTALLMALSVFACVPAALKTAAAVTPAASTDRITAERAALQRNLPQGYTLTDRRYTDGTGETMYYITGKASVYGLKPGMWVDAAGNEIPPEKQPYVTYDANAGAGSTFPAAYDARDYGLITDVEYQMGGTCWAHAAAAVMEANAIKKGLATRDTVNLSEYYFVWYSQNGYYEGVTDPANDGTNGNVLDLLDEGGNYQIIGYAVQNHAGPAQESRYSLDESKTGNYKQRLADEMAEKFTFEHRFDRDFSVTAIHTFSNTVEAIKDAILTYGAAQFSYCSYDPYYNYQWNFPNSSNYHTEPCTFYCPVNYATNHAVTVVGWDDGFSRANFATQPPEDGAWLVKNSWSSDWGSGGYFWISYYDATLKTPCAYEVEPLTDREHARSHNGFLCEDTLTGVSAAAGVYSTLRSETVTYVTTGQPVNGNYTFTIYSGLPQNVTDPTAGTQMYTQSGSVTGVKWIPVNEIVDIPANTRFSVVFTLSGAPVEGAALPSHVAIDLPCTFTSAPGGSFVLQSGQWKDTHALGYNDTGVAAFTRDVGSAPYTVTFSCPGHYQNVVLANTDGTVALPQTEGHTWTFTYQGQPFDGTGVDRNITVISHCYPTAGTLNPGSACETEYKCVFCGEDILPTVDTHQYVTSTVAAAREHPGYTQRVCSVCHKSEITGWTIHPDGDGQVLGDFVWQYYDGAVSFAGSGAAPDFTGLNDSPPWNTYASQTVDFYMGEGLTHLGAWSFCYFNQLKNISFPSTLKTVGNSAFYRCDGLEEAHLPASVTKVGTARGDVIYSYCNGIRRLIVDEGVRSIDNTIIRVDVGGTAALEEIVIPASVQSIDFLFTWYYRSSLQRYVVDENNLTYTSVDGVLYNKSMTQLLNYPPSRPGVYYKVPSTVRSLLMYAFSDLRKLKYLDLSETALTATSKDAFNDTVSLSNVNLPANLNSLASKTFVENSDALQKIYIPSTLSSAAADSFTQTGRITLYTSGVLAALNNIIDGNVNVTVLEGHVHSFTDTAYEEPATCSEPGFAIRTCECGQFEWTETPANGQHVKASPVVHPATCTEDGYTEYTCSLCGTPFTDDVVPAPGHDWEWITDLEPTCGETGLKHEKCKNCTATRNMNTSIPATGAHQYEWVTDLEPTCAETGLKHEKCKNCTATRNMNTSIPATGEHQYEWVTDLEPTCAQTGLKHEKCVNCTATRNPDTVIPATGAHQYTAALEKAEAKAHDADCTHALTYYYSCAGCGRVEGNDAHTFTVGSPLDHSWEWIVDREPTCGETGLKHEKCVNCTATRSPNTSIPATGAHQYEWVVDLEPTCAETGLKHEKCKNCTATRSPNTSIPATGAHQYEWVVDLEPTCAETGLKHEKCKNCTATRSLNTSIPATGSHTYTAALQKAEAKAHDADCTHALTYYYSCATCGRVEGSGTHTFTVGSAMGHVYRLTGTTPSTCKDAGENTYTCERCSDVRHDPLPLAAHSYGGWVTEREATCTDNGISVRYCTVCNARDTQTIPAPGHRDADGDGYCDACNTDLNASPESNCVCGQYHSGPFAFIIKFFHRITYFFKNLFG